jgi:Immunity protein 26
VNDVLYRLLRRIALIMPRRGIKPKIGDVFEIPIDDSRVACGQIVAERLTSYLMVVFRTAHERGADADLAEILNDDIAFMAESFDGKIWNGHWPVVGNVKPDLSRILLPVYKVSIHRADNLHVVSYDGLRRRPATRGEREALRHRLLVAPILVERAVQALHGAAPWDESYRPLEYETVRQSAEVIV